MKELPDLPVFPFFKPSLIKEDVLDTIPVASWVLVVYIFNYVSYVVLLDYLFPWPSLDLLMAWIN